MNQSPQTSLPRSLRKGEAFGFLLIGVGVIAVLVGPRTDGGGYLVGFASAFIGGVIAVKANGRKTGKTRGVVLTWLGPFVGSILCLGAVAVMVAPSPAPRPAAGSSGTSQSIPAPPPPSAAVQTPPPAIVSSRTEIAKSEQQPPKPSAPDIKVTAVELSRDYQNNEVAADNRYQDKLLEVRGTVVSIDKGVFDEVIVQLSGGSEQDAHAFMAESEKIAAAALRKGKAVTVLCHGGGMTLGSPMLKDCTFANSTDSGDDLAQNAKKSKWIVQCLCDGRVFAYQKLLRARNKAGALDKACTDVCEDRSGSLGGRMNVNLNVCKRQCIHGSIEPYASCEWHVNRDGQSN